MRPARTLVVIVLVMLVLPKPSAEGVSVAPGFGVLVSSPTVLGLGFKTQAGGLYSVFAYHEGDATRVQATRHDTSFPLAEPEEVELPASALALSWNAVDSMWHTTLDAQLPRMGHISLDVTGPSGSMNGFASGCEGFYDLVSPAFGLEWFGWVEGYVDGSPVFDQQCLVWGRDVSGTYSMVPYGTKPVM